MKLILIFFCFAVLLAEQRYLFDFWLICFHFVVGYGPPAAIMLRKRENKQIKSIN